MVNDIGVDLRACLLKEGGSPGREHERLEKVLRRWAEYEGYSEPLARWSDGTKPDVFRWHPIKRYLFVGDAKDAKNEKPSHHMTRWRIRNYVRQFSAALDRGCGGGFIAIATNDENTAYAWVRTLNQLAEEFGITATHRANPAPDFVVEQVDARTWIVWW